jgi:hypothetical protein
MAEMLKPPVYFSYGQFLVYDASIKTPGCRWTEAHYAQGFARRESAACFATLLEHGNALFIVTLGPYEAKPSHKRVISVPFQVLTGKIAIDGPEEFGVNRCAETPPGAYQITVAQEITGPDQELVELFLEPTSTTAISRIIIADKRLNPPSELIESADVA